MANSQINTNHFICELDKCIVSSVKSTPDETSVIQRAYDMYDSEGKKELPLIEVEKALIILLDVQKLPKPLLQTATLKELTMSVDNVHVGPDQFCELYHELNSLVHKSADTTTLVSPWQQFMWSLLTGILWWPYNALTTYWSYGKVSETAADELNCKELWYDVFLGGTCANSTWRKDITIPLFKEHQISYFNPHVTNWSEALAPYEARAKKKCNILLYVITGHSTSVGSLVEVSYHLGTDQQVVLCIQDIDDSEPCLKHLSSRAARDYNRGRSYLKDAAIRKDLTVFSKVEDATMETIRLVQLKQKCK